MNYGNYGNFFEKIWRSKLTICWNFLLKIPKFRFKMQQVTGSGTWSYPFLQGHPGDFIWHVAAVWLQFHFPPGLFNICIRDVILLQYYWHNDNVFVIIMILHFIKNINRELLLLWRQQKKKKEWIVHFHSVNSIFCHQNNCHYLFFF